MWNIGLLSNSTFKEGHFKAQPDIEEPTSPGEILKLCHTRKMEGTWNIRVDLPYPKGFLGHLMNALNNF